MRVQDFRGLADHFSTAKIRVLFGNVHGESDYIAVMALESNINSMIENVSTMDLSSCTLADVLRTCLNTVLTAEVPIAGWQSLQPSLEPLNTLLFCESVPLEDLNVAVEGVTDIDKNDESEAAVKRRELQTQPIVRTLMVSHGGGHICDRARLNAGQRSGETAAKAAVEALQTEVESAELAFELDTHTPQLRSKMKQIADKYRAALDSVSAIKVVFDSASRRSTI